MGALGAVGTRVTALPNIGITLLTLVTDATVDDGDTITVDLTKYGCTNIHGILGFREDTEGSIIVRQDPTTSVSSGTLTLTIAGSTGTKIRSILIWAY